MLMQYWRCAIDIFRKTSVPVDEDLETTNKMPANSLRDSGDYTSTDDQWAEVVINGLSGTVYVKIFVSIKFCTFLKTRLGR